MKFSKWTRGWNGLHNLHRQYPAEPSAEDQASMKRLLLLLSIMLPCFDCGDHYETNIKALDMDEAVKSSKGVQRFMWRLQNKVNVSTGRPEYSWEDAQAYLAKHVATIEADWWRFLFAITMNPEPHPDATPEKMGEFVGLALYWFPSTSPEYTEYQRGISESLIKRFLDDLPMWDEALAMPENQGSNGDAFRKLKDPSEIVWAVRHASHIYDPEDPRSKEEYPTAAALREYLQGGEQCVKGQGGGCADEPSVETTQLTLRDKVGDILREKGVTARDLDITLIILVCACLGVGLLTIVSACLDSNKRRATMK